jgi:CHAT domain-containing protein
MSGLILSLVDRRGRRQDGYLRLGDIYKLKLSADLVVLSSCDSALGKDLESEGIIGLPRGFLYAGAKSVIASLWKVNDDATATLMSRLYARLKKGETPSSALRGAQLEMEKDEQWSNPYYWAAFVLQGEYR